MSIIPNSFRKQKKYITDENGDHELVSTWTSTDTVETTDGETLTDYLDSHVDLTIDVTTPSEVAKRYTFTQNDTVIGVVDIPLDMVVSAATVETVVTPDVPYEGAEVGDKYIDMVIANSSEDHIYIPCKDIISADSVEIVKQTPTDSTDATYELLFSGTADNTEHSEGARKSQYATFNPSKKAFTFGIRASNSTVGDYSHAEGIFTTASGDYSHAEGGSTIASGNMSHAEGAQTIASGNMSHAECYGTESSGNYSHAEGNHTIANHKSQHVFGEYNIEDSSSAESTNRGNYVEIVGNGTITSNRSNARTLDWDGNEVLAGKITVGAAPTNDMDVATKKYVDDNAGGGTDEKVKQMDSSTSSNFRLLLSNSANDTTETAEVKKNATLTYNPGTQSLKIAATNNANQHTTIQSGGTITTNDPSHLAGYQNYLVDEYGNRKTTLDHNINFYRSNNSQQFNGRIEAYASYSEDDANGSLINVNMELTPDTFDPKLSFKKQVATLSEGTTTIKTVEYGVEDITLSETWDGTHTSLKDAIANAGGGTTVVANPTGTPTDELTSIQIGEDIYNISSGGGGGGNAGLQKTVLLSTPITTTGTYTLADDYTNYDFIAIQAGNGSNEVDIHMYAVKEIISAMSNNMTVTNPNTGGWFNFTMNADELTIPRMQLSTINSVVGYKVVGGGGSGGADAQIDTLFSANDYQENITLAHPYTDYDVLIINGVVPINNDSYQCSTTYITDEISINNNIGAYTDGSVIWYNVNDTTHLSCISRLDVYVTAIYGIKYGSSGGGGTNVIEKTQAQYNALTQAEKENGSIYMVKDNSTSLIELTEPQTSTSTKVTASSYMVDTHLQQYHYPWAAFNRVSPSTWEYPTPGVTSGTAWSPDISVDGGNSWIQYYFETPVRMAMMTVWAFADYSSSTTKSFIIEGSNDGTTWTNILASGDSCSLTASLHQNYINEIPLNAEDSYAYVRLRSLEPMGASYQPTIFIDEIFVYGYGTTSVNRIYYMDTEYANTEVGGSGSDPDIVTYNTTVTTSEYGWWIVEDENGNALDPSQYIIVDIVPRYDEYTETAVGCRWTINSNVDGSNTARYSVTLENINDGGFIRSSRTVELQVSYKLK